MKSTFNLGVSKIFSISTRLRRLVFGLLLILGAMILLLAGCGNSGSKTLFIGGIPDQNVAVLEKRFDAVADYLSKELGIPVKYVPSISYSALVTAFSNGDVGLGWFGGLTGVQARIAAPGANAVAQRPGDAEFQSVFIVRTESDAQELSDLKNKSFTFGSEASTSGHLMPRYFLRQEGIDPEKDFKGQPSYSGSHDKTLEFVKNGTFEAGALNAVVWNRSLQEGSVDTTQVRVLWQTDEYFDYHWLAHPDLDAEFGANTTQNLVQALLKAGENPKLAETFNLFQAVEFIPTRNENYSKIESIAAELNLLGDSRG